MAAAAPLDPRFAAMMELERRGTLPPELQSQLDIARQQGVVKGGKPATDGEKTAAFLTTRLEGALKTIKTANAADPSGASPGVLPELARKLGGDTAANYVMSDGRQRVENAQLDALDSALTLGTGAAYSKEQLAGYSRSYFPQLGDSAATIKDKADRFEQLIQAARVKSGNAAPNIDTALAKTAALTGAAPTAPAAPATELVDSATAAGRLIHNGVDSAAGITPPPPVDRKGKGAVVTHRVALLPCATYFGA